MLNASGQSYRRTDIFPEKKSLLKWPLRVCISKALSRYKKTFLRLPLSLAWCLRLPRERGGGQDAVGRENPLIFIQSMFFLDWLSGNEREEVKNVRRGIKAESFFISILSPNPLISAASERVLPKPRKPYWKDKELSPLWFLLFPSFSEVASECWQHKKLPKEFSVSQADWLTD